MTTKSMVDIAFDLLNAKKNPISFTKLYEEVTQIKGFEEEEANDKISLFYTNITLDGRFITVGENNWDLRSRHKFEAVHIDMNDIYADDEVEIDVEEEDSVEVDDYN